MLQQKTVDKITDWAQNRYAGSAPSLMATAAPATAAPSTFAAPSSPAGGMLSTAVAKPAQPAVQTMAAPAPAANTSSGIGSPTWKSAVKTVAESRSTPTATPSGVQTMSATSASPAPAVDVGNWYRSTLGRDGDAAGINFWQNAIKGGMSAEDAYKAFQSSAATNKEIVKPTEWAKANTYQGVQSSDRSTPVDDWARNVLGRNLTASEMAEWNSQYNAAGASGGPQAVEALYQKFLDANAGTVKNPMNLAQASQISFDRTPAIASGPVLIDPNDIKHRNIDQATETVRGQLGTLLSEDSPVLQQARADAMRTAAERGMLNSSMAASGGTDALIRSALNIATPDAGFYNRASDYNVSVDNQTTMWNAEQQNQFARQKIGLDADTEARREQLGQQMTIAQMQDATSRYNADLSNATSRYNTDQGYKQQVESNKRSLVNNIIANMDLSPDRKAAMLEQLGEGTSTRRDADGNIVPGTGLAGAVYVIDSIADDLRGPYKWRTGV